MSGFNDYSAYDGLGLADLVRTGQVRPEEILDAAIARIESLNPRLNAVVHTMYDEARRTIAAGLPKGAFAGVPFMLKDLSALYEGAPTTNGSRLFAGHVADHDSEITRRYRAAGLVVIGKTNTPEFGLNVTTEPVMHGPTLNPWDPGRNPGGSSGGAAAAVASGMVPMAHATDGAGSIRIPAAACGLFGLKPTRARNPPGPDAGEAWSGLKAEHAVTRTVRDSAALLDATNGAAPGDPYRPPLPARPFLEEVGADPGRLRIAFFTAAPGGVPTDRACVAAVEEAARLCTDLGHAVEEAAPHVDTDDMGLALHVIVAANVRVLIDERARALGREATRDDVENVTWLISEEGKAFTAAEYARAIKLMHGIGRKLSDFLEPYDLVLTPTLARPPLPLGALDMMGNDLDGFCAEALAYAPFTAMFNFSGQPAASVPLHWTADGLPVGVQFAARFGDEATLFRLAAQLEQAKPWKDKRPPIGG